MDDALTAGLHALGTAATKQQLIDALWDLRDAAYDQPHRWDTLTAEKFLQALAEELDQTLPDDGDQTTIPLFARALTRALNPQPAEGPR